MDDRMKFFSFLALLPFLMFSTSSTAVIISEKDWYQVSAVTGFSWNTFDQLFDENGKCIAAECMIGPGINLTDYIWANNLEVDQMLSFIGQTDRLPTLSTSSTVWGDDHYSFDTLFNLMSPTKVYSNSGLQIIRGQTRDEDGTEGLSDRITVSDFYSEDVNDYKKDAYNLTKDSLSSSYEYSDVGAWFYKTIDVPEPSTLYLLIFGLASFNLSRRYSIGNKYSQQEKPPLP